MFSALQLCGLVGSHSGLSSQSRVAIDSTVTNGNDYILINFKGTETYIYFDKLLIISFSGHVKIGKPCLVCVMFRNTGPTLLILAGRVQI